MLQLMRTALAVVAVAGLAFGATTAAEAKSCTTKYGKGSALSQDGAKFQVDEILLQSTDWGAWAAWMASGATPGYSFGPRTYKCGQADGWWTCTGKSTICKL